MRILFVVKQKGFLRHFEEVVLQLAQRGHSVRIASPSEDPVSLADTLSSHARLSETACQTHRSDRWRDVIQILRASRSYARYWDPRFARAPKLRFRAFRKLASELSATGGGHFKTTCPTCRKLIRDEDLTGIVRAVTAGQAHRLALFAQLVERGVPSDRQFERFLERERPDVVVVTPLVTLQSFLPDYVKSAQALGIPTITPVFSWDNLTNKGLMHVIPDRVLVWNETQRLEATELHDVPADRVEVTGAPRFDPFMRMTSSESREQFCEARGFDPGRHILVYLGSSKFVAPDEMRFVRRWIQALKSCGDPGIETASLVLRPHPRQRDEWLRADLTQWGTMRVSVSDYRNRNTDQQLFNCLHHAVAAVGLNTSAAIEAALTGTPVYTVMAPEFGEGQTGTLHFHYLLEHNGGCVRAADSLEEHASQIAALLAGEPDATRDRNAAFVADFVKGGLVGDNATGRTVRAIEAVGGTWLDRTRRRVLRKSARALSRRLGV